jgi:cyclopropane-fatty-acyl-phospholipid synthase
MNSASQLTFDLTEQGFVPDLVIRRGIRYLVKKRLREIEARNTEKMADTQFQFITSMAKASTALVPEKANEQHYEVPASFYLKSLGPRLKYSCAYWPEGINTLAEAEVAGLQATCEHAQLEDGQNVLELGCGWGSLTLWMAEHYPASNITAVSNSASQREFIEARALERNLDNIRIITCDMNDFDIEKEQFDRIVSVEMFEHMRNWSSLYKNVASWLKPGGRFFKHIFVHRTAPYAFEVNGSDDWMSEYFFSGGMMPSDDLPLFLQQDFKVIRRWRWDGTHYEKTANAWLKNTDEHREDILRVFKDTYGDSTANMWLVRWRMFFMACAELFGYDEGQEWHVSHYLFEKPSI